MSNVLGMLRVNNLSIKTAKKIAKGVLLVPMLSALAACSGVGVSSNSNSGDANIASAIVNNTEKFSSSQFGVAASPRLTSSTNVPKGGGRYQVGKPYKVAGNWYHPSEDTNYDETGKASWYGPNFHGRLTANGEVFDQFHLSAAHPTLPLPSYVRVQNQSNGRSVVVRVNDRGPFAHNRLIDLSRRTAEVLGFIQDGTAQVRVTYLGRAPLEGDDTQYLVASINAPDYVPNNSADTTLNNTFSNAGRQPSIISREAGGLFGSFASLFSYAPGAAQNDALNAAEQMAVQNSTNLRLPMAGQPVNIELGMFKSAALAAQVAQQFAMLGAVETEMGSQNGHNQIVLRLVYLKSGVTRADIDELAVQLQLD